MAVMEPANAANADADRPSNAGIAGMRCRASRTGTMKLWNSHTEQRSAAITAESVFTRFASSRPELINHAQERQDEHWRAGDVNQDARHFQRRVGVSATMARTTRTSLHVQGQRSARTRSAQKSDNQRGKPVREALQQIHTAHGDDGHNRHQCKCQPIGLGQDCRRGRQGESQRITPDARIPGTACRRRRPAA